MHNISKKNDQNLWGPFLWGPLGSCPLCPLQNPALYVYIIKKLGISSQLSKMFHLFSLKRRVKIYRSLKLQWKLGITRSLGPRQFVLYIRYIVIWSVVNKKIQNKGNKFIGTGEISLLYQVFRYISDLFISSFQCNTFQLPIPEINWLKFLKYDLILPFYRG